MSTGNVKCNGCGRLVWAERARPICMACREAHETPPFKRLDDLAAFRAWRDHADDDELLTAVEEYRRDANLPIDAVRYGVLIESSAFIAYIIARIRERERPVAAGASA